MGRFLAHRERIQSLEFLTADDRLWVPASFVHAGDAYAVKLRLRGDLPALIRAATDREKAEQDRLQKTEDFREGVAAMAERRIGSVIVVISCVPDGPLDSRCPAPRTPAALKEFTATRWFWRSQK